MMRHGTVSIRSHFDGKVFVPDEPVNLPRGQSAIVHVDSPAPADAATNPELRNAWDVLDALAGSVEAPPDWSAEHDHYLYGTPKRDGEADRS